MAMEIAIGAMEIAIGEDLQGKIVWGKFPPRIVIDGRNILSSRQGRGTRSLPFPDEERGKNILEWRTKKPFRAEERPFMIQIDFKKFFTNEDRVADARRELEQQHRHEFFRKNSTRTTT